MLRRLKAENEALRAKNVELDGLVHEASVIAESAMQLEKRLGQERMRMRDLQLALHDERRQRAWLELMMAQAQGKPVEPAGEEEDKAKVLWCSACAPRRRV